MCSINGFYTLKQKMTTEDIDLYKSIVLKAQSRGRDGFGIMGWDGENNPISIKSLNSIQKELGASFTDYFFNCAEHFKVSISNNRAEPTTEFFEDKTIKDLQPYVNGDWCIVHNGTIANDIDLIKQYELQPNTRIDSAVISALFEKINPTTFKEVVGILKNKLIGSYALSIVNTKQKKMWLATNYKPLFLLYKNGVYYFSSLEEYLSLSDYNEISNQSIMQVEPYTCLEIDLTTGHILKESLYKGKEGIKKALIIASSGLDSTVAASWAKKQGYEIELLHYAYNCKAQTKELESIKKIAQYFDCPLTIIPIDFYKDIIGGSRLFEEDTIVKEREGIVSAELALEWVPARNLVFMSLATAFAESKGYNFIVLGGNLEESGSYADNELIFQKKFNDLLPFSLNLQNKINVLTPIANLMKKEIVELGLELNAPLHLTWSCYENGDIHCGKCGPCYMRRTAFKMLKKEEVITYKE